MKTVPITDADLSRYSRQKFQILKALSVERDKANVRGSEDRYLWWTKFELENVSGSERIASRIHELRKEGYVIAGSTNKHNVHSYRLIGKAIKEQQLELL